MKEIVLEEKSVYGMTTRTNLKDEMDPARAKIGPLWQKFDREVPVAYEKGERVYGLYYDYVDGMEGDFSVTAAYDGKVLPTLEEIHIEAGKYLLFEAEAARADDETRANTVLRLWGEVWAYFEKSPQHVRAFKRDFDFYRDATHIEVYVSIL